MSHANERVRIYLALVFVGLLFSTVIMFRSVVLASGDAWHGRVIISREELVPIFDFQTQFFDQMKAQESPLTSSPEMRVSYSAITAWARSNALLPITLVLFSTISLWMLVYSMYYFVRYVLGARPDIAIHSSLFPGVAIGFIVLYSKIAHFYTLVFGFSLFVLALTYTIHLILSPERPRAWRVFFIALLVLLNPAIHFHVLYYIATSFFLVVFLALEKTYAGLAWRRFGERILMYGGIVLLSAVPYAAFIYSITASLGGSLQESIPIDYWIIYYASVPLEYLFALNMPGHVDLTVYGSYVSPHIRFSGIILTMLALLAAAITTARAQLRLRIAIFGMLGTYAISLWMSAGYASSFSLHSTMSTIVLMLDVPVLQKLFYTLVQILRYPHRFEFILFVAVGLLAATALALVYARIPQMRTTPARVLATTTLLALFFASPDYFGALKSGTFNDFLRPLPVGELSTIDQKLEKLPPGKLMVLPSLESGRELVVGDIETSFLDKTLIYYLNYPSFYYGSGSGTQNKYAAIRVYAAILAEESWWDAFLYGNLGIDYILVPKTVHRNPGLVYVPELDEKLARLLHESDVYGPIYDGESYDLYSARVFHATQAEPLLVSATDLSRVLENEPLVSLAHSEIFAPMETVEFLGRIATAGRGAILTDRPEDVVLDILTSSTVKPVFPASSRLPFDSTTVNSSFYLSSTFSYFTLFDEGNEYNHFRDLPTSALNVMNPYFYQVEDGELIFQIPIAADTEGRIVIRGTDLDHSLVTFSGLQISLKPVRGVNNSDFQYFTSEPLSMTAGVHTLSVKRGDWEHGPIIEYAAFIPRDEEMKIQMTHIERNRYMIELKSP